MFWPESARPAFSIEVSANLTKLKVSMTIDEDIFAAFKNFCKQNGMKVSTKVEQLMKDNVKNATLQQFIK